MLSPPGWDPDFPGCSADPCLCLPVQAVLSFLANPFVSFRTFKIWPWVFCPRHQALLSPSYSTLLWDFQFVFGFGVLAVNALLPPTKIGIFCPWSIRAMRLIPDKDPSLLEVYWIG